VRLFRDSSDPLRWFIVVVCISQLVSLLKAWLGLILLGQHMLNVSWKSGSKNMEEDIVHESIPPFVCDGVV
jgi:hypothetical protein